MPSTEEMSMPNGILGEEGRINGEVIRSRIGKVRNEGGGV